MERPSAIELEQNRADTWPWNGNIRRKRIKTHEQHDEQRLNRQFGFVLVVVFRLSRHWKDRLFVRMTFEGKRRRRRLKQRNERTREEEILIHRDLSFFIFLICQARCNGFLARSCCCAPSMSPLLSQISRAIRSYQPARQDWTLTTRYALKLKRRTKKKLRLLAFEQLDNFICFSFHLERLRQC